MKICPKCNKKMKEAIQVVETEAIWWKEGGFYIAKPEGARRVFERCRDCNTELRGVIPKGTETDISLTESSNFVLPTGGQIQGRKKESFHGLIIEWIDVTKMLGARLGHGIQFIYPGRDGMLVAFIDGFGWYHGDSGSVRVFILSPKTESWGGYTDDPKIVLRPLKDYIRLVLTEKKIPDGATKDDIFCRVNG